ncbi:MULTISPECIES: tyrosine-type recombinase/integrase [unclassified Mesorhizobium]|uniref:tyrosine-type recombinase/integrase n=1 Tax=unclassified Mesorhizobium TaxID=325217 RepID=UPI0003CE009F|nr:MULTISPECIES: tyrosine-type recombinase/integrase [unclassified Mesorhizobium]ESX29891.1 integrase [Mesorhizobium sp. LSHC440B00]ESX35183.1 integrase [Mesorhizobium sp. LSHC432A00]ESX41398.1 integrase [Mesorhizobium sp. LSHC440A00]WJI55100.1 tyrosine-type recombinase/integrase [Mesorhizobium sp. C432A]
MAKTLKEAAITTASARSKLVAGEYPRRLDADAAVWYRKGKRGGVWFARWRNWGEGANYLQSSVGPANDVNDKPTDGLLTFAQAETLARQIVQQARQEQKAAACGPALTVRAAVETYIGERDARDSRRKGRVVRSDAGQRLRRYVLGQEKRGGQEAISAAPLASVTLHMLKESDLLTWRADLPEELKGSTAQRLINDLKAALNGSYGTHRERLEPTLPAIIKHGLKAEKSDSDDAVPLARDNQILTAAQVGTVISAAREIDAEQDWDGDLFRFVVLLAATGARFSQIARMRVGDVQRAQGRLMIPSSRKGRGGKIASVPYPVGNDVLDALLPATARRSKDDILLERWRSKQVAGSIGWERAGRAPWQSPSELQRPWNQVRQRARLPAVIPYGLRHSSIVRGIRANLPIRLVAALHDTSVPMIERHYGRWIVDGLEDLAAKAVVPLVPVHDGNVVRLRG